MTKIYHFANLVCWREINDIITSSNEDNIQNIVYCDTMSLKILGYFFNKALKIRSGVNFTYENQSKIKSSILLTSGTVPIHNAYKTHVLPKNLVVNEYQLNRNFSHYKSISIGISSPKQNTLALRLAKDDPSIETIYCLGAAIDIQLSRVPKPNINAFYFLFKYPKRTVKKLYLTIGEAINCMFKKRDRNKFCEFLGIISQ